MSSVNVDFEDLIRFKATLERNAQHFDEIRTSIGTTINTIADTDWKDEKSAQFRETFFAQSDPDITKLVETMMGFATYLQGKIPAISRNKHKFLNY